jgi:TonB family protein
VGGIFVSYRRRDSQGEAGRLFDDLAKHFGEDTVFMDVAAIEAGRDFRKAIEEGVTKCGVLLVVIGSEWLDAKDEHGTRRLNDPSDFVRIETASALRRDIPVIPVLVRGAKMPSAEQLPDELKELAYRNCIELTHARWRSDIQLLTESLRRLLGDTGQVPSAKATSTPPSITLQGLKPSPKSQDENPAAIDPADIQRVTQDLALRIGPIAGVVVRRATPGCSTIDGLYLKVAEEIDSPEDREKFVLSRTAISAPPRRNTMPAVPGAGTRPSSSSAASESPPRSAPDQVQSEKLSPVTARPSPSRRRYTLIAVAASVAVILALVLVTRYSSSKGLGASQSSQPPAAATPNVANASDKSGTPVAAETSRKNLKPVAPSAAPEPAAAAPTHADSQTEATPPQRVTLSEETSKRLLVRLIKPVYPLLARQGHIQGVVVLNADISKEGAVENVKPVSGHPILIPSAIEAVKQWRYKPYVLNGDPVPINTEIVVDFTLLSQ